MCIRICIFKNKTTKQEDKKKKKKAKKTKEEKRISVKNLTGYDDIVCEFPLCIRNLLNRIVNFFWLLI